MKIPVFDLKRQYEYLKTELDNAFTNVFESGNFILGENVRLFEEEFRIRNPEFCREFLHRSALHSESGTQYPAPVQT